MITFFSIPRAFEGEFDELQRVAMSSWLSAVPGCQIVSLGDELPTNEQGTPLINKVFEWAEKVAEFDMLCEISADIILGADFEQAIKDIQDIPGPFMIGQRWDINPGDEPESAKLHSPAGIDYFVYRKGTIPVEEIPPFAVGRAAYDNWLVWAAINRWGLTVIDATNAITAIHVNHAVNANTSKTYDEERRENIRLAEDTGCNRWCGVTDAPYVLHRGKVKERDHA